MTCVLSTDKTLTRNAGGWSFMLRKIIRGSGFTQSEEKLIEFADDAFFGLWSYPNVYSDEGYSKIKLGKKLVTY